MGNLEDILEYEMPPMQAKAFKLSLLWERLCKQEFPDYPHVRLKVKGDPRKSILFRYCYKLVRDYDKIIPDEEFQLYMLSQLHVMKAVMQSQGLIDPRILVGDKAWRRWRLWKRRYDKQMRQKQSSEDAGITAPLHVIKKELEETRKFLNKALGGKKTYTKIESSIKDKNLVRWVNFDNVSPYYIILSPWVAVALDGDDFEDVFMFDTGVYFRSVTEEVKEVFREIFPEEEP